MKLCLVMLLALACQGCPVDPPKPPPGTPDVCAQACIHLREMSCIAGADTPDGTPCETVCADTEATGYTTMYPACIVNAASCEEADHVSAYGCQ